MALDPRLIRERVERKGLHEFVRQFWPIADPASNFSDNWHIGAVSEHLEAVSAREIRNLVINIPPGTGKSTIVSVLWPGWHWSLDPRHRWMFASFDVSLVYRDAEKMLNVLRSDEFKGAWPEFILGAKSPAIGFIKNCHGGTRFSTSVQGKATGHHAHTQVCDDPIKPLGVTEKSLKETRKWWTTTMSTRQADAARFARVIIMQRLHENDLAGAMLREYGYEHLCLPMSYVPNCTWDMGSSLGKLDPRTEPGEPLDAQRFPEAVVKERAKNLGSPTAASAQEQQNPLPETGSYIESEWLRVTWKELPPKQQIRIIQSWDFGFKGSKESHSRVSGTLWAEYGQKYFLLDEVLGHFNFPKSKALFYEAQRRKVLGTDILWSDATVKIIEDKANGTAIIDEIEELPDGTAGKIYGIHRVSPKDDKTTRLVAHTNRFHMLQILFPLPAVMPTVEEFRAELVGFPNAAHDDRVDTTTQALDYLASPYAKQAQRLKSLGENR